MGERIYANSGTRVYSSSDNGETWDVNSNGLMSGMYITDFYVLGDYIFLSQFSTGAFVQHKDSLTWRQISEGLNPSTYKMYECITVLGNNAFIGTFKEGIWRRPLGEILTSVSDIQLRNINYILKQNYPNPFNPKTTITFELPVKSFVLLKIFDALGREGATLINDELSPGMYSKQWDASGLPSGIYFYRLVANAILFGQANSFIETKKLILLK